MTNSPFDSSLKDIFGGMFDSVVGDFFPGNYTSFSTTTTKVDGPKYKVVSSIGIGTEVVTPEAVSLKVVSLSDVGDNMIELVFDDGDSLVVWSNIMLEVK